MGIGSGEPVLAVVDLVAEVEVLGVRRRSFSGQRPGNVEQRGVELAGVHVLESEQHVVQRATLSRHPALAERNPEHRDALAGVDVTTDNRYVMPLVEVIALIELPAMPGMVARKGIERLSGRRLHAGGLKRHRPVGGAGGGGARDQRAGKGAGAEQETRGGRGLEQVAARVPRRASRVGGIVVAVHLFPFLWRAVLR